MMTDKEFEAFIAECREAHRLVWERQARGISAGDDFTMIEVFMLQTHLVWC